MSAAAETLVLEHEVSVPITITRCDGPGCASIIRERDLSVRPRGGWGEFTDDSRKGWWGLWSEGREEGSYPDHAYEFCSWNCLKAAMLGMPEPVGD